MKRFHFHKLGLVIALVWSSHYVCSQNGCSTPGCFADTLIVSTGYDHSTGTIQSPVSQDANWDLVGIPTNATAITLPSPTWVINPNSAWSTFPNGAWVSPFQTSQYSVNNPPGSGFGAFEFRNCFCICDTTSVYLRFDFMSDDLAAVRLDGVQIDTAGTGYHFQYGNRLIIDTTIVLTPGTHCLEVGLYNTGGVAMGFAVDGYITGVSLLSASCCDPTSSICGTKYNDLNCDTSFSSDPGLSGWVIELKDSNGNVIATDTTDGTGSYCFDGLPAGTYTVCEVNQAGWTQTFPASPGTHTIVLDSNESVLANFANCQAPVDPCEFELNFEAEVTNCLVKLYPAIGTLPSGYQIISTTWTFGDGHSSNEFSPTHAYLAPGTYEVCLTVTIFNGEECCTRTVCRKIEIVEPCEGGCEFDVDMDVVFNADECSFDFSAIVNYAGVPITTWYWDFGDGTTGYGSTITHRFPCQGVYEVCLYIFGQSPDGERCCFTRVCKVIEVPCDPCDKSAKTEESGASALDGDLQLYPNPNSGNFNIDFEVQKAGNAQLTIIDMKGTRVYAESLGSVGEGFHTFQVDAQLPAGTYLCDLLIGNSRLQERFVIE